VDLVSAEFGIAGALSGDKEMLAAYRANEDVYLRLAKMAGVVPADATKQTHREERALYKTCLLAKMYGQTPYSFARNVGCSIQLAKVIHLNLEKAYPSYWNWIDRERIKAGINREMSSPSGWKIPVTPDTKDNLLLDYPMQAACADILRLAAVYMIDEGIALCATIHDAVLIEGSAQEIELDVETVQDCWRRASSVVLDGFELKGDAKIIRYPETYTSKEGENMYDIVKRLLAKTFICPGAEAAA
jgi:DNA polymerase I-like protein with 3'-5' exonuclease and polymerase domains